MQSKYIALSIIYTILLYTTSYEQDSHIDFQINSNNKVFHTVDGIKDSIKYLKPIPKFYTFQQLELQSLINLEILDLSKCNIKNIDSIFEYTKGLKNLKYLILDEVFVKEIKIPKNSFVNLTYLSIANCGLKNIDSSIGDIIGLEYLNLGVETGHFQHRNQIKNLPNSISKLVNLKTLIFADQGITQIPEGIFKLRNLVNLNLSGNKLMLLPNDISKLLNLNKLDLSSNLFDTVPKVIGELKNLKYLNLAMNKIKEIPLWLFDRLQLDKLIFYIKGSTIID
jgi:Leucine-rich repeat (LRR) protein